jgi:hypothetical protein
MLSAMEAILLIREADGESEADAADDDGGRCCCEGESEEVAEPALDVVEATVDGTVMEAFPSPPGRFCCCVCCSDVCGDCI